MVNFGSIWRWVTKIIAARVVCDPRGHSLGEVCFWADVVLQGKYKLKKTHLIDTQTVKNIYITDAGRTGIKF